jgi:DNA-binding response OmpR family regulator
VRNLPHGQKRNPYNYTQSPQLKSIILHFAFITYRVVDFHIVRLRRKIEPESKKPRFIRGVRGLGNRFEGGQS